MTVWLRMAQPWAEALYWRFCVAFTGSASVRCEGCARGTCRFAHLARTWGRA